MSEYRWLELAARDDGVRILSLNKPPVNALGRELVAELTAAFGQLGREGAARCLIVRSTGKHFCAGADLKERRDMSVEEVRAFVPRLAGACSALAAIPYPTIAAVSGAAAGGGCELALAADFRILAEDARIGLRETALAIIPAAGGTQRLPRLIGPAKAKRWVLGAEMHDAASALEDGVADRVVATDLLDEATTSLAETIAGNGPVAVRLAKRAIDRGAHLSLDDALAGVLDTEDRVEALEAFAGKRPPRFRGR
jgi:enoyl-CoA hydratase/carnithine racemase